MKFELRQQTHPMSNVYPALSSFVCGRGFLFLCMVVSVLFMSAPASAADEIRLFSDGAARCAVVVPEGSMAWEGDDAKLREAWAPWAEEPERLRRLQRDSAKDLAYYLGKIGGAEVEIVEGGLEPGDDRVPIFIGPLAEKVFGPVGISKVGKFGFRVVGEPGKGIGLYGESEYGTSYAVYELLDRLGCRWFMPSELGEVIPSDPNLVVGAIDEKLAPATEWRSMQSRTADHDFRRRNRFGDGFTGGNAVWGGHFLEKYVSDELREANPDWRLVVDGEPHPRYLRWTNEEVSNAIADHLIAQLDENYQPSISLNPGDYVVPTEDPEERKFDPEPRVWDAAAGRWSVSDRLMLLANRVAERVGEKYPDVLFNLNAYVNYSLPPVTVKPHPNVIPALSPIDFNRHHPMTWEDHPNEKWLLEMVQGWAAVAPRIKFRGYGFNLAEITAPNPFITKWGTDIPILMENNTVFWAPETMGGWESMLPGFYMSMRIPFDPSLKPDDILAEMWPMFYGPAAAPMEKYWRLMDRAWIEAREFSGSGFGYLRIFTPEILAEARKHIDEALSAADTREQYERVKMVAESLGLIELFMKMREDFAEGRLRDLENDLDDWVGSVRHLRRKYRDQFAFDSGLALRYVENYFGHSYRDGARMQREYGRFGQPVVSWKYKHNPDAEEKSLEWTAVDFDDSGCPETHVVRETWSTIGHHNSLTDEASGTSGRMVYRATARLPSPPEGKRVYLWFGSIDGSAKLFVNGQPVDYVVPTDTRNHKAGDKLDRFPSSFCRPALFDVTEHLKQGENQLTVLTERDRLWELGTGGLMSPGIFFREK
jgi:hypothetical protein